MKPALGKKIKLKATLKGKPQDGMAIFGIFWEEDLDEIKGKKNLDDRTFTIEKCPKWCELETKIKSNKATVEADSVVAHDSWGKNTNALEIYACIRAEYKFISDVGCRKVSSRFGTQGIDHVFKKGKRTYIVESKTVSDLTVVSPAITKRSHNAVLKRLGKGRKVEYNGIIVSVGQMTKEWVDRCLYQLQQDGDNKETIWEVAKVMANMRKGIQPQRVLNIYGGLNWNADGAYNALRRKATRVSSKFKRKKKGEAAERSGRGDLLLLDAKWETHDPKSGKYYLLPGKYTLMLVAAGQWVVTKKNIKTVAHADKPYKNEEFFLLDKLTKRQCRELGLPNEDQLQQAVKDMDSELKAIFS